MPAGAHLVDPGHRGVAIVHVHGALLLQGVRVQPRERGAAVADDEGGAVGADAPPVPQGRLQLLHLAQPKESCHFRTGPAHVWMAVQQS